MPHRNEIVSLIMTPCVRLWVSYIRAFRDARAEAKAAAARRVKDRAPVVDDAAVDALCAEAKEQQDFGCRTRRPNDDDDEVS
jgi:hypothetical protein